MELFADAVSHLLPTSRHIVRLILLLFRRSSLFVLLFTNYGNILPVVDDNVVLLLFANCYGSTASSRVIV